MKTHSCTQESWRSRFPACTWSSTCPWWRSLCRTPPGRKNLQVGTRERVIEQTVFISSFKFSYRSQEVVRRRRRRHHATVEHRGRFASPRRKSTWRRKKISIRVHLPSIFVPILLNYNEVVTRRWISRWIRWWKKKLILLANPSENSAPGCNSIGEHERQDS